jgi:hypothetical protein
MVVCDTEGTVYDLWYHPASYHEVKSLRKRVSKSVWLRWLLSRFELIGDRAHRQVVEGVFSWLKRFNFVSGWRKGITLLTYLYAYAVGYSFYRNIKVQLCA